MEIIVCESKQRGTSWNLCAGREGIQSIRDKPEGKGVNHGVRETKGERERERERESRG